MSFWYWPGVSPVAPVDATERSPWEEVDDGPLALAGTYTVELHTRVGGEETLLAGPVEFEVRDLGLNPMAGDQAAKLGAGLIIGDPIDSRRPEMPLKGGDGVSGGRVVAILGQQIPDIAVNPLWFFRP